MVPQPTGIAPDGRTRTPVKAFLFDVYGTLLISGSGDIGHAEKRCGTSAKLERLGRCFKLSWPPAETSARLFAAIRQQHEQARKKGVAHPEVKIDRIWQGILGWPDLDRVRQFARAFEYIANPTYPMPGLDQVLRTLRRRRVLMGILSNAQFFTPLLFETFLGARPENLGFAPDLILYSFEFGQAKPSTALFAHLRRRLRSRGVRADEALYVGNDMRNDIRPAQATGFQTALFAGDQRSLRWRRKDAAIQPIRPDLIITNLNQLLDSDRVAFAPVDQGREDTGSVPKTRR
jgi:putative hydrolase of the HAD superfamily